MKILSFSIKLMTLEKSNNVACHHHASRFWAGGLRVLGCIQSDGEIFPETFLKTEDIS